MGKIKKILENELVGGTQTTDVYPVTSVKAVYDENNERLDHILNRRGVVNISTNYNDDHIAEVLTLSQALSKVPSADRVIGFQGKYLASDSWHTIIYTGDSLTSWSDKTKWIDLADKVFNSISKNSTFAGIATSTTNPGTPDGPVFYIATQAGTYINFNNIEVAKGEAVILQWNNGAWTKKTTGLATEQEIIYDVSARNEGAVFESLQALLSSSNLSTLIPTSIRHGGMTIRFIQSSVPNSDKNYVQYRLMSDTFNTIPSNWQGVEDVPTAGSDNLLRSSGVKKYVDEEIEYNRKYASVDVKVANDDNDLAIADDNGNEVLGVSGGNIRTAKFNSARVNTFIDFADVNLVNSKNSTDYNDLDITDTKGNSIASFEGGHIKTKGFDSANVAYVAYESSKDALSLSDNNGNVILSVNEGGHIKTKGFDSALSSDTTGLESLVIGKLIQGKVGDHKIDESLVSVVSSSLAVPYLETEFSVFVNNAYRVTIYGGYVDGDAGTYFPKIVGTFSNRNKFVLPKYADNANTRALEYIRIQVNRIDGGAVALSDNINLSLLYAKKYSIADSNSDIIDELQAKGTKKVSNKSSRGYYPTIVHGSDIHGDFERLKNLYSIADIIDADAVVLTGDLVAHNHYDYIEPLIELAKSHKVPTLICSGNHEVGFAYGSYNFEISDAEVYDYVFAKLSEYFEYKASNSAISTVPYFYKDIPSKKVRFISLYQYINGTQDAGEELSSLRWDLHYNQDEIDWFCTTLASTPDNYGVVLLIHTPELSQTGGKIQDNDLFFTDYNFGNIRSSVQNGQPILEIIDAFISRGTLQKTYAQKGTPSSFIVSADFTEVPTGVEFIAQVSGHYHRDAIGLVNGAKERQVSLNISCTAGVSYQSNSCDTPRNINNKTGDSFNVYVVNKETKAIDVYKIGAHYTTDNRNRTHMSVQYK